MALACSYVPVANASVEFEAANRASAKATSVLVISPTSNLSFAALNSSLMTDKLPFLRDTFSDSRTIAIYAFTASKRIFCSMLTKEALVAKTAYLAASKPRVRRPPSYTVKSARSETVAEVSKEFVKLRSL